MKISQLQRSLDSLVQRLSIGDDLRAVLVGAGLLMLIQIVSAALNYASQVLLARWMGASEFGVYVFAWSWAQPISVAAAIGLSAAAIRFVPQYLENDDWGKLHGLIRRSTALVLVVGVLVAAAGWGGLALVGRLLADEYILPTRLVFLCVPFLTSILLVSGVARGFGRVALAFVPRMLLVPGLFILAVGAFKLFVGTPTAVQATLTAVGVCGITALGVQYRFRLSLPERVRAAAPVYEASTWLRVAIPLFLADGVVLVLLNVDVAMLGALTSPEDVAIYHASAKTAALTYLIFNAVRALAAPRFARIVVTQDLEQQQRFVGQIARWTFWPTALLVLVFGLGGRWVLSTFGDMFTVGYPVLLVLFFGFLSRAATGPLAVYLSVSGHQDHVLRINAVAAVANVMLNAVLIPQFGIMGAAAASVLSLMISQIWLYVMVRRRLGINSFFVAG